MKDLVKKFDDAKQRISKLKLYKEGGRQSLRGSLGGNTTIQSEANKRRASLG